MIKVNLLGLLLFLGMILVACDMTSDKTENANDSLAKETVEEEDVAENGNNRPNPESVVKDDGPHIELQTGSTETVSRETEGMAREFNVINYQIQPYSIAYQLDEFFGVPEVKQNQITYSYQDDNYQIIFYQIVFEIMVNSNLEKAVSDLQERFETEGYEESFELESLPVDENGLRGKMQFFDYPIKGFIAYEIDEHVLAITFRYPVEAGDSMYPLLESLRKSIKVK